MRPWIKKKRVCIIRDVVSRIDIISSWRSLEKLNFQLNILLLLEYIYDPWRGRGPKKKVLKVPHDNLEADMNLLSPVN